MEYLLRLKSKKFALFSHNIKQNIFMFSMGIKISQIILFEELLQDKESYFC